MSSEGDGVTVIEVAQQVLDAFCAEYRTQLLQLGAPPTGRMMFEQVAGGLVLALPFAHLVESRNEDALLTAIENLEGCENVRALYKQLSVDQAEKLWRFAEFFFKITAEAQQGAAVNAGAL